MSLLRLTFQLRASILLLGAALFTTNLAAAPDPVWQNLSSKRGEIPVPPGGSVILDFNLFDKQIDQVIAEAKALGVSFVGTAGIPHQSTLTEADVRKAAEVFNRAGEALTW